MTLKKVILLFLILFAAWGSAPAQQEDKKIEVNAVLGWAGTAGGIIKSFGYRLIGSYVVPEASIAVFEHTYPLSANLTLQLPIGIFCPYVTAGYGYSLSGFSVSNMGAGLKVWISESTALLFDFRKFKYTYKGEKMTTDLYGVGFSYRL